MMRRTKASALTARFPQSVDNASMGFHNERSAARTPSPCPGRVKLDPGSDADFYSLPRFVKHVDDKFLQQVTQLYRQRIPEGGLPATSQCMCQGVVACAWRRHLEVYA